MKKPNITPGEWRISRKISTLIVGKTHDGYERSVASAGGFTRNTHDETPENEANAKAIAAVPQLIEALVDSKKAIESLPSDALGIAGTGDGTRWYVRDELLSQIKTALRDAGCK